MRKKINPAVAVGIVLVAALGIGLLGWKLMGVMTAPQQAVVRPSNPDDPKYSADPKLAMPGTAAAASAPKGNSSD